MATLRSCVPAQGGSRRLVVEHALLCLHPFKRAAALRFGARPLPGARRSIRCRSDFTASAAAAQPDEAAEVEDAWRLLLDFNKSDVQGTARGTTQDQRAALRAAVLTAAAKAYPSAGWDPAAQPSSLMMGVLSGDVRLAVRALRDYTGALSAEFVMPMSRVAGISNISGIQGGVYIKYNAASRSATVDTYSGACRGVLLQLGQQQIGHLPLGLLDEGKSAPPPI